ncbi:hypothetical protein [Metabacillus schmidteae]|uniref:hypothetical protein n=1 Tax=Metabacillus schmidteae TaxID=2730405 RepID=UPI001588A9F0|nr:hypothetical protein [Metabacillus schmidteae]
MLSIYDLSLMKNTLKKVGKLEVLKESRIAQFQKYLQEQGFLFAEKHKESVDYYAVIFMKL